MNDKVEITLDGKKDIWSKADVLHLFDEIICDANNCDLTDASVELSQKITGLYIDGLLQRREMPE